MRKIQAACTRRPFISEVSIEPQGLARALHRPEACPVASRSTIENRLGMKPPLHRPIRSPLFFDCTPPVLLTLPHYVDDRLVLQKWKARHSLLKSYSDNPTDNWYSGPRTIKHTRRQATPVYKHLLTFYALCRRFHHCSARHSLYLALSCNLGSTLSSQAVTSCMVDAA